MPGITDRTPLETGCYFHIYNRGINREKLFYNEAHYLKFISRYYSLLGDYVETYAYCLLPNHFHFMIRIKDSTLPGYEKLVSTHLNTLFSQHALMINKEKNRYGSLFCKSFKRIKIKSNYYLNNLIVYIHRNPLKHNINADYQTYRYSSFNEIIHKKSRIVKYRDVISLYGGYSEFISQHETYTPYVYLGKLVIEKSQNAN